MVIGLELTANGVSDWIRCDSIHILQFQVIICHLTLGSVLFFCLCVTPSELDCISTRYSRFLSIFKVTTLQQETPYLTIPHIGLKPDGSLISSEYLEWTHAVSLIYRS